MIVFKLILRNAFYFFVALSLSACFSTFNYKNQELPIDSFDSIESEIAVAKIHFCPVYHEKNLDHFAALKGKKHERMKAKALNDKSFDKKLIAEMKAEAAKEFEKKNLKATSKYRLASYDEKIGGFQIEGLQRNGGVAFNLDRRSVHSRLLNSSYIPDDDGALWYKQRLAFGGSKLVDSSMPTVNIYFEEPSYSNLKSDYIEYIDGSFYLKMNKQEASKFLDRNRNGQIYIRRIFNISGCNRGQLTATVLNLKIFDDNQVYLEESF